MINEHAVQTNSAKAWVLASRPKTLTGAAVPVMIGTALALRDAAWQINRMPAVLCFLFAFIMQIDANFINDYFDFIRHDDDENRLGPKRACAQGWITTAAMRRGIAIATVLACMVGAPLIVWGGLEMIICGALCVVFCFLYTTHLSRMAMGDVLVLLFFGILPVVLTYYLEMPAGEQHVTCEVFVASIACGTVVDALLVVNNYRDLENDRRVGKRTLAVVLGPAQTRLLYLGLGITACLLGLVFIIGGSLWASLLPMVYLWLHVGTYRKLVQINQGRALNRVLGDTARNIFLYGLLVAVGLLL
ncbi:1,4-dihydroxy-2-naphthoate octaprenyltransferase [Hoylesella enoeca]|uniref:1,4-dihydroxy-2-naphthoate octaprenyltransferase n=1 Tax=Hoylesella enoeca TaxID=76123 RepID=UPI00288C02EE|nr:1,4-dihydroxy-2-naphthoate octaprenyltransferase [Hoylesella enoeca]